ncbi:adenosylcobinamide-GDP ribazoletransferase [Actinopolymorpha alba]|uniref:adenosylcobinamide-GDP ribazoletransferase n=1 Tax=Actinopolymorpha alba TaxID=533267 RepID=UPI00039CFA79|nr:adenosylcobinamide-GDP ribazoletransferase [Actinopolymorpha alba]
MRQVDGSVRRGAGLGVSVTMFTALPFPGGHHPLDRRMTARAVLWLPFVGACLGLLAALPWWAVSSLAPGTPGALLGATLAVGILAVATRGLHLDGLADTIDGLGSAAPPDRALEIMRKSDIGPFGVIAVLLVLLVKVTALAATIGPDGPAGAGALTGGLALVLGELLGRFGVVLAAGRDVPVARPDGFGALVAGTTRRPAQVAWLLAAILLAASPLLWGTPRLAGQLVAAVLVGSAVAVLWRRRVVRRIGGVTGDVFGSIVELTSTAVLLTIALTG